MRSDEVLIRALTAADLAALGAFRCSGGELFEDVVEQQIRDSVPLRYLGSPPHFDDRMLKVALGRHPRTFVACRSPQQSEPCAL